MRKELKKHIFGANVTTGLLHNIGIDLHRVTSFKYAFFPYLKYVLPVLEQFLLILSSTIT